MAFLTLQLFNLRTMGGRKSQSYFGCIFSAVAIVCYGEKETLNPFFFRCVCSNGSFLICDLKSAEQWQETKPLGCAHPHVLAQTRQRHRPHENSLSQTHTERDKHSIYRLLVSLKRSCRPIRVLHHGWLVACKMLIQWNVQHSQCQCTVSTLNQPCSYAVSLRIIHKDTQWVPYEMC